MDLTDAHPQHVPEDLRAARGFVLAILPALALWTIVALFALVALLVL